MKKSELRQIIKEEIKNLLREGNYIKIKDLKGISVEDVQYSRSENSLDLHTNDGKIFITLENGELLLGSNRLPNWKKPVQITKVDHNPSTAVLRLSFSDGSSIQLESDKNRDTFKVYLYN